MRAICFNDFIFPNEEKKHKKESGRRWKGTRTFSVIHFTRKNKRIYIQRRRACELRGGEKLSDILHPLLKIGDGDFNLSVYLLHFARIKNHNGYWYAHGAVVN